MEKIVINAMLSASIDEDSLWGIFCEINGMFPEHNQHQNLIIAKMVTIWMYRTNKITFYSNDSEQGAQFFKNKSFLHQNKNWNIESPYAHTIFTTLTDIGDAFYDTFVEDFTKSLKKDGLIRKGKKYALDYRVIKKNENHHYLFWVNDLVRTLGMPSIKISQNLVQYVDHFTHMQCILDTSTNFITDISYLEN